MQLVVVTPFMPQTHVWILSESTLLHNASRLHQAGGTSVIRSMQTGESNPGFSCAEVLYPEGEYEHPPSGLLQIRVVRRGSSNAEIDLGAGRKRMFTRPGDILLSLPDRSTYFRIESARHFILLQVEAQHARRLVALGGAIKLGELTPLLEKPVRDPVVAELCRRILERDDPGAPFSRSALVVVMLTSLAKARAATEIVPTATFTTQHVKRLTAFVDSRLDQPLSAPDLANELGMAMKPFVRAFTKAFALPVYLFILRRRVEMAVKLLRETTLPLTEVALRSGFAHQSHMTRTLSRLRGETPKQIRARE